MSTRPANRSACGIETVGHVLVRGVTLFLGAPFRSASP